VSFLDVGELADIRADVNASLPDVCNILKPGAAVSDGQGGQTPSRVVSAVTICRVLADQTETEVSFGGKVTSTVLHTIYLPWDSVLDSADWIQTNGVTYEVMGRSVRTEQAQVIVRCALVE